jgi:FAD:protein FMN transferase
MRPAVIRYEASHLAMGTEFTLVCYGDNRQYLAEVGHEVFEEIDRLEAQLSKYNPKSEISVINRMAAGRSVSVAPKLFELLVDSIHYSDSTDGAFDVTAGPLMKAWGFFRGKGRVPAHAEIARVLRGVGYQHVHLNGADRTIHFDVQGLELDLGAIGKGYAVDEAVDILRHNHVTQALISSGTSSVYVLGAPPGLRGWPISLRNPYDKEKAANVVRLSNCALSTSGNYETFFKLGAKTYAHILDPTTGRPVENMLATTVMAESACAADALSTAFYVMGVERSRRYIATHRDLMAVFYMPGSKKPGFQRVVLRSASSNMSGALLGRIGTEKTSMAMRQRSAEGLLPGVVPATRRRHLRKSEIGRLRPAGNGHRPGPTPEYER